MSNVTNIILKLGIDDGNERRVREINAAIREHHHVANPDLETLVRVDQMGGGNKHMEVDLYIGALNYLDTAWFIEQFRGSPWDDPETVQLFLQKQEEYQFKVYTVYEP